MIIKTLIEKNGKKYTKIRANLKMSSQEEIYLDVLVMFHKIVDMQQNSKYITYIFESDLLNGSEIS